MTEQKTVSTQVNQDMLVGSLPSTTNEMIFSPVHMKNMDSIAALMASGEAGIPDHLRGKQADCLAVVMQACAWGMNPFQVARSTHLVSGTLGFEAKLVNAVISSSTAIIGRFHYDFSDGWERVAGKSAIQQVEKQNFKTKQKYSTEEPVALWDKADEEGLWVRVGAILRDENEIQWGQKLHMSGVLIRNSPLWVTKPDQQMCYLALKYWSNLYTPSVTMGVHTPEELKSFDYDRGEKEIQGEVVGTTIKEQIKAADDSGLDNFDDAAVETVKPIFENADKVIRDIAKAQTVADLKKIEKYAAKVEGDHLDAVRAAYRKRKLEIAPIGPNTDAPAPAQEDTPAADIENGYADPENDDFRDDYNSVDSTDKKA